MLSYPKSLFSSLLGAAAVTVLNEGVRRITANAPRLEELGMEAAEKTLNAVGAKTPSRKGLYWGTMAADLISNALYYSIISLSGKSKVKRWSLGTGLGLAAGLGAILLPEPLELDSATTGRTTETKVLTIGWYLGGALLATAIVSMLSDKDE
jgi:hypothetical protein